MLREKSKIAFESRYLLGAALAFVFLPTKAGVESTVLRLAANQVGETIQWLVVIFLSAIPMIILAIPAYRFGREELKDIQERGLQRTWKSTLFFSTGLLLLVSFCAVRILYWIF
ncbi:MAG: hypothetical protein F6J95_030820 [Leptolyngbya sp. SIO1E4]|nr:hypothetical protein [Leptolyngbya sp. SIO1E4]